MRIKQLIYIAALGFMASCSDDITGGISGDDDAIVLRAGISDGSKGVMTRAAGYDDIDASNHAKHLAFTSGTKAAIRIDGDWWKQGDDHATLISQPTTATIGDETSTDSKHNNVSMSPQLYWDEYGTADPANAGSGKGREKGLTIYGAAVNGETTAPTVSTWTALPWSVEADQTSGWSTKDLLVSNNVRVGGPDDTYKFDERASGKLIEFTHAMSKITVNLTAGTGFADSKFVNKPEVILLGFNYTGTVNVETKASSPTGGTTDISAHLAKVKANTGTAEWSEVPATWTASHQTQYDAIVFPGNLFEDATEILTLSADGNDYKVTAAKLNAAIDAAKSVATSAHYNASDNTLLQAVNYVLNITVNKTGIDVTATIKNWETVESEEEAPIININKCYGQEGTNFAKGFTFYRSTAINGAYGDVATVSFDDSKYTMTPQRYWPDHSTHYFFRGIWPEVGSSSGNTPTAKVTTDAILVDNSVYSASTYPTDLMIGMPRKADGTSDEHCKAGHTEADGTTPKAGICATDAAAGSTHDNEGLIHMNFQYAMSQVIVRLQTSSSESPDKVTFDEHTSVEIVDCYNGGKLKLSDGSSDFTDKTITNFQMTNDNNISPKETNNYANYRNVIIPQLLTNGTGGEAKDLKFRISVGDGSDKDVYETVLGIKNIKVSENGGDPDYITAWEPGKIYIYTLKITKTDIIVTATIKNWITVTAEEEVWF